MLGHGLRGPTEGPADSSLVFAMNTLQWSGRVGRPQTNLFFVDLKRNISDLLYLRNLVLNKVLWRRLQFNRNLLNVHENDL